MTFCRHRKSAQQTLPGSAWTHPCWAATANGGRRGSPWRCWAWRRGGPPYLYGEPSTWQPMVRGKRHRDACTCVQEHGQTCLTHAGQERFAVVQSVIDNYCDQLSVLINNVFSLRSAERGQEGAALFKFMSHVLLTTAFIQLLIPVPCCKPLPSPLTWCSIHVATSSLCWFRMYRLQTAPVSDALPETNSSLS